MDFIKALQSIEEFLYELTVWIVILPKTFIRVFFTPKWIQSYVLKEWNKEEEISKRFDSYLSPLYFFAMVSILPVYLVFSENSCRAHLPICKMVFQQPPEIAFAVLGVYTLLGPLVFSVAMQLYRKKSVGIIPIRRIFYTQCYCFAPYYLLLSICERLGIYKLYDIMDALHIPELLQYFIIFTLPIIWIAFVEILTLSQELEISYLKSFIVSVIFGICTFILSLAILITYFIIYPV